VSRGFLKSLAFALISTVALSALAASQEVKRLAKEKRAPAYPELAKRMNISGTVKVEVTVAPSGSVKAAKALGGHPLLIEAAVSAAKHFKYETAASESTEMISFNFNPN
jgi:TonB family protein